MLDPLIRIEAPSTAEVNVDAAGPPDGRARAAVRAERRHGPDIIGM